MAFKCKGNWNSWVNQPYPPPDPDAPNDGKFEIGTVGANGKFKGKHKKGSEEHDLDGECIQTSKHHIEFTTTEGYTYSGDIEGDWVRHGTRSGGKLKRSKKVLDDDDWVAVKVT